MVNKRVINHDLLRNAKVATVSYTYSNMGIINIG